MPIATSPSALPRPATLVKMEDRKRPASNAVDDGAPPTKRQAVNGGGKSRDDAGDMKEESWIEVSLVTVPRSTSRALPSFRRLQSPPSHPIRSAQRCCVVPIYGRGIARKHFLAPPPTSTPCFFARVSRLHVANARRRWSQHARLSGFTLSSMPPCCCLEIPRYFSAALYIHFCCHGCSFGDGAMADSDPCAQEYQKGAIYRQMLEYKREKQNLEARLQEIEKNSAEHDDHIRIVDAWVLQVCSRRLAPPPRAC